MEVESKEQWRARTALLKLLPRLRFPAPAGYDFLATTSLTVLNDLRKSEA